MPARLSFSPAPLVLAAQLNVRYEAWGFLPDTNELAPGRYTPCVTLDARGPVLRLVQWGLAIPYDNPHRIAHLKGEIVDHHPDLCELLHYKRCYIPIAGYCERAEGSERTWQVQPHPRYDDRLLYAAALYTNGYALLTAPSTAAVGLVSPRMPYLLSPEQLAIWMDSGQQVMRLARMLREPVTVDLDSYEVTRPAPI